MYNIPNIHKSFANQNTEETHYSILGVPNTASYEQIKKAYRKLSLEYHPDRNRGNLDKSEKYKKITEAYKIISDESERKKYDFSLNNNIMGMGIDIDPSMFMNMFLNPDETRNIINEIGNLPFGNIIGGVGIPFGGVSLGRTPLNNINSFDNAFFNKGSSKPETIYRDININLFQAYKGCKFPLTITRWIIENNTKIEQNETIYIEIRNGIDNNEIITILNKGNRISDTNSGNIEIKVSVKNHEQFERNGIDLIYKKSITLKESLCGFSFDLTYIDGKEFKINNKAGNIIPSNFRKIIPKMGMKRDDDIGDLIIIFDIVYPKLFTSEQIKALEKIL